MWMLRQWELDKVAQEVWVAHKRHIISWREDPPRKGRTLQNQGLGERRLGLGRMEVKVVDYRNLS
jgi:hypothetical protein